MSSSSARPLLLVTGMPRSGASLVASLLLSSDMDFGLRFPPPTPHNPLGVFEDIQAWELNRRILIAATREGVGGLPEWGIRDDAKFDRTVLPLFADEATTYLRGRSDAYQPRAYQDARAALLLDFWEGIAPNLWVCGVYREPWDVVASFARLGDPQCSDPALILDQWLRFNRCLLEFHVKRPGRCLLVPSQSVRHNPFGLIDRINASLGIDLVAPPDLTNTVEGRRLRKVGDPGAAEAALSHPGVREILEQLDSAAMMEPDRNSPAPAFDAAVGSGSETFDPETAADPLLLEGWRRAALVAQKKNLKFVEEKRNQKMMLSMAQRNARNAEKRATRAESKFLARLKKKMRAWSRKAEKA